MLVILSADFDDWGNAFKYGAARFRHRAGALWVFAFACALFGGCDARAGRPATIASAKSCRDRDLA